MMVLVDTSVWISHLRSGDVELRRLLEEGLVLVHPSVIGELSCADFVNRQEILSLLAGLPFCQTASDEECLYMIDNNRVRDTGIGWSDAQLIASARVNRADLYTKDNVMMRGWDAVT